MPNTSVSWTLYKGVYMITQYPELHNKNNNRQKRISNYNQVLVQHLELHDDALSRATRWRIIQSYKMTQHIKLHNDATFRTTWWRNIQNYMMRITTDKKQNQHACFCIMSKNWWNFFNITEHRHKNSTTHEYTKIAINTIHQLC